MSTNVNILIPKMDYTERFFSKKAVTHLAMILPRKTLNSNQIPTKSHSLPISGSAIFLLNNKILPLGSFYL